MDRKMYEFYAKKMLDEAKEIPSFYMMPKKKLTIIDRIKNFFRRKPKEDPVKEPAVLSPIEFRRYTKGEWPGGGSDESYCKFFLKYTRFGKGACIDCRHNPKNSEVEL